MDIGSFGPGARACSMIGAFAKPEAWPRAETERAVPGLIARRLTQDTIPPYRNEIISAGNSCPSPLEYNRSS